MPRLPWARTSNARENVVITAFNVPVPKGQNRGRQGVTAYGLSEMIETAIHVVDRDWRPCTIDTGRCLHCQNEVERRIYGYFGALVMCQAQNGQATYMPHAVAVPEASRLEFPSAVFGQKLHLDRTRVGNRVIGRVEGAVFWPAGADKLIDPGQVLEYRWFGRRNNEEPPSMPRHQLDQLIAIIRNSETEAEKARRSQQGKGLLGESPPTARTTEGDTGNDFSRKSDEELHRLAAGKLPRWADAAKAELQRRAAEPVKIEHVVNVPSPAIVKGVAAQIAEAVELQNRGAPPSPPVGRIEIYGNGPADWEYVPHETSNEFRARMLAEGQQAIDAMNKTTGPAGKRGAA